MYMVHQYYSMLNAQCFIFGIQQATSQGYDLIMTIIYYDRKLRTCRGLIGYRLIGYRLIAYRIIGLSGYGRGQRVS